MLVLGLFGSFLAISFLLLSIFLFVARKEASAGNPGYYKTLVAYLVIGLIGIGIAFYGFSANSSGSSGGSKHKGDGISTCQNCGRKGVLDGSTGYCSKCYESFLNWMEDYYD